jgi:hypothetical protein
MQKMIQAKNFFAGNMIFWKNLKAISKQLECLRGDGELCFKMRLLKR